MVELEESSKTAIVDDGHQEEEINEAANPPPPQANVVEGEEDEEQLAQIAMQEIGELNNFLEELEEKIRAKKQLRQENLQRELPDESYFAKLDSNLKRNTAFVKKLRQFTASQMETLLKDMNSLNLTKYISEICSALVEAKFKMTDVPAVVSLCSRLHQTYAEFHQEFFEAWHRLLILKHGEKYSNPSKLRVDLRLYAELVSGGVISTKPGLSLLGNALIHIIGQDKEDHSNLSIILSFCRHCGEEYAGLVPRKILQLASKYEGKVIPKSDFLTPEKQHNLRNLLKEYFRNFCKYLTAEQTQLINMKNNLKISMASKGEVSSKTREKCELKQANFEKLLSSAQMLSDLLDEEMPQLVNEMEQSNCSGCNSEMLTIMDDEAAVGDPWRDDETRSFYTELPDLRQFLPNFSAPKVDPEQLDEPAMMTEEAILAEIDNDPEMEEPPSEGGGGGATTPDKETTPVMELELEMEAAANDKNSKDGGGSKLVTASSTNNNNNNSSNSNNTNSNCSSSSKPTRKDFDRFLLNLNNCVNKELIDSAAIDFLLNYNTKNNRKKLSKSMISVHRNRWDLLPFLSRFVAIINHCHTDVALDLSELLRKEFKWHVRMKNQLNIESKIKVVRFMGEMVKFALFKKFDALSCLKILLRDFQHHHIEMACAFIEVAGIYLYNCKESRWLMNSFLDQMMRLKTATALDSRYSAQIENVYYLVKPPEVERADQIQRPPMLEFIRHLIFKELNKQTVERCLRMMKRINWHDPVISGYAIKCLSKAYLLRFPLIRCLADLVSGLGSYQERAVSMVIDNVFEDIRAGLEIHSLKLAQRRIAMAKYLGELYNYKLVDSNHILNTLYSIISLGVVMEEGGAYSELDPPDSLFRLKLVCVLLDTCGLFFTSNSSKQKLDYFLIFFQHYYWFKKSHPIFSQVENSHDLFPILVDHMYRDCLTNLKPKIRLFNSLEQAKEAVEKLKEEMYPQLDQLMTNRRSPKSRSNSDSTGCGGGLDGLQPIPEDSEMDDEQSEDDDDSISEIEGGGEDNLVAVVVGNSSKRNSLEEEYGEDEDENEDDEDSSQHHHQHNNNNNDCWADEEAAASQQPPTKMMTRNQPEKSKDDLEFEQMFEKMAQDCYQERLKESIKPNIKDITVPMMVRSSSSTKKTYEQLNTATTATNNNTSNASNVSSSAGTGGGGASGDTTTSGGVVDTVPFVLMVRGGKGGKQQFKQFAAPSDSQLAINLRLQEEKIREEKEKVKRLTLNITERIEEEDYQDSLMQTQRNHHHHHHHHHHHQHHLMVDPYARSSKPKFKHQKGAPDADLIFH